MRLKKCTAALLALGMALSLAACGAQPAESAPAAAPAATEAPATPETTETEQAAEPAEEAGEGAVVLDPDGQFYAEVPAAAETVYPVTLTDQAGREVTLEAEPQTLVSGYYISTSLLVALGQQDKLVGIEAKADTRPIYARSAPELLELPSVGTAKEFDLEGCAALDPDLVVLPLKLESAVEPLEALGIDVLLVDPEDQERLNAAAALLGAATNAQDRANELLAFTEMQQGRLAGLLAGAERPTVYLAGNSDFLSTAGGGMYQSGMIELAGGENVAADITEDYWATVSYEQILAWDPEYIVLASDAGYTVGDVLADPNLAGCTAVENSHVLQIPGDAEAWDSPVPGGILGSVWLSGALHPELAIDGENMEIINDFYETFYGFTYQEY